MTAILRPGDKIHLAFPINDAESSMSNYQFHKREYAAQGVEIAFWTGNSALTHPVVVAVFRSDPTDE